MNKTMTDSLSRAIAYLGAVEVAPGRYAFTILRQDQDDWRNVTAHVSRYEWFTVSADDLALHSSEPYSEAYWLQAYAKRMPAWWTPEQQFAQMCRDCGQVALSTDALKNLECQTATVPHDSPLVRVTADLTTGEEVPA